MPLPSPLPRSCARTGRTTRRPTCGLWAASSTSSARSGTPLRAATRARSSSGCGGGRCGGRRSCQHPSWPHPPPAAPAQIIQGQYAPIGDCYSPLLAALVDLLLSRDTRTRPSAVDILRDARVRAHVAAIGVVLPAPAWGLIETLLSRPALLRRVGSDKSAGGRSLGGGGGDGGATPAAAASSGGSDPASDSKEAGSGEGKGDDEEEEDDYTDGEEEGAEEEEEEGVTEEEEEEERPSVGADVDAEAARLSSAMLFSSSSSSSQARGGGAARAPQGQTPARPGSRDASSRAAAEDKTSARPGSRESSSRATTESKAAPAAAAHYEDPQEPQGRAPLGAWVSGGSTIVGGGSAPVIEEEPALSATLAGPAGPGAGRVPAGVGVARAVTAPLRTGMPAPVVQAIRGGVRSTRVRKGDPTGGLRAARREALPEPAQQRALRGAAKSPRSRGVIDAQLGADAPPPRAAPPPATAAAVAPGARDAFPARPPLTGGGGVLKLHMRAPAANGGVATDGIAAGGDRRSGGVTGAAPQAAGSCGSAFQPLTSSRLAAVSRQGSRVSVQMLQELTPSVAAGAPRVDAVAARGGVDGSGAAPPDAGCGDDEYADEDFATDLEALVVSLPDDAAFMKTAAVVKKAGGDGLSAGVTGAAGATDAGPAGSGGGGGERLGAYRADEEGDDYTELDDVTVIGELLAAQRDAEAHVAALRARLRSQLPPAVAGALLDGGAVAAPSDISALPQEAWMTLYKLRFHDSRLREIADDLRSMGFAPPS